MSFLRWNILNWIFKVACTLATVSMVSFWIIKFQKNEDLSVIEYKQISNFKGMINPEFTVCLKRPFLANKLGEIGMSSDTYSEYLEGKLNFDYRYKYIDFNNVTFELFDHLKDYQIQWLGENHSLNCTSVQKCSFVTLKTNFEGSISKEFHKCFGVEIRNLKEKKLKAITINFKQTLFGDLSQIQKATDFSETALVTFHYPNQFLKLENAKYIWKNSNEKSSANIFMISAIELLKRRNKNEEPCISDWKTYDDLLLNKHLEGVTCRTPYQNTSKPICATKGEMLNSIYEFFKVRKANYPEPCQEISKIDYQHDFITYGNENKIIQLMVVFPEKIKLITQSQSVDGHALIGNIGGYIGLFLGKNIKRGTLLLEN